MADNKPVCKPPSKGYRSARLSTDSTMVTIELGDGKMLLPMDYLTSVSHHFEKAFTGEFCEAKEKILRLDDTTVSAKTLGVFAEWLYGRKLLDADGEEYDGKKDGEGNGRETRRFNELLALYIFGDAYDIPQFRRDVLDTFIIYAVRHPILPSENTFIVAYAQLPPKSPILRALVDLWVQEVFVSRDDNQYDGSTLPSTFLYSVTTEYCLRLHKDRAAPEPIEDRLCDYHEHDEDI
ncbi:hypothetical protein FKW77_007683 [Venturia effusa]|uniref:BTB domain-containing protein n=1 Tax=Venturia effusa TaxID=50376 RepID=A0A517LLT0_9PEZI|nr:hypothetical protein FKW77_007683 [Venturia effusa]